MTTLRTDLTVGDICAGGADEIEAWHPKRQGFLRTALERLVKSSGDKAVENYMSLHRRYTSLANCQMLCKTHNRAKGNA